METGDEQRPRRAARPLLILLGCLWLGYAAILLVGQVAAASRATLTWKTESEVNTAGFNVYRSDSPDGPWQLRNPAGPVPAVGGPTDGAEYEFIDRGTVSGSTYYYVIEEVEFNMTTRRYNDSIVALTARSSREPAIAALAASVLLGAGGIWLGLKGTKGPQ